MPGSLFSWSVRSGGGKVLVVGGGGSIKPWNTELSMVVNVGGVRGNNTEANLAWGVREHFSEDLWSQLRPAGCIGWCWPAAEWEKEPSEWKKQHVQKPCGLWEPALDKLALTGRELSGKAWTEEETPEGVEEWLGRGGNQQSGFFQKAREECI